MGSRAIDAREYFGYSVDALEARAMTDNRTFGQRLADDFIHPLIVEEVQHSISRSLMSEIAKVIDMQLVCVTGEAK